MTSTPSPIPPGAAAAVRPIATFDLAVLDTPEPRVLADFYCSLLGWEITDVDADWIAIRGATGAGIAFQLAPDFVPSTWPDPTIPQQAHLDLNVPDLEVAERQVLSIGARATGEPQQGSSFRVFGSVRSPVLPLSAGGLAEPRPARRRRDEPGRHPGRPDLAGSLGAVRFLPVTPARLVEELADWISDLGAEHPRVGFDGPTEIGTAALADEVALRVRALGRPVVRVSTRWWWRPASLRLEFGRTDIDMLLSGWIDTAAIRRELFDPLLPGGSGRYLPRLRDPDTDRSLRESRVAVAARSVLLLDGPFLQASGVGADAVVRFQVSTSTLARSLPVDRQWWVEAFERYRDEDQPADGAAVVVAYDHPAVPAIAWARR